MTIVIPVLYYLLQILWIALLARVILSWIAALAPNNPLTSRSNPVTQVILMVTDPILIPLRRIIPPIGMVDLSPMVAFFLILLLQRLISAF